MWDGLCWMVLPCLIECLQSDAGQAADIGRSPLAGYPSCHSRGRSSMRPFQAVRLFTSPRASLPREPGVNCILWCQFCISHKLSQIQRQVTQTLPLDRKDVTKECLMRDIIAPIQGKSICHTGYQENANQITGDHLPHIRLIILHSFIHSLGERVQGGIKREDKKKNQATFTIMFWPD